MQFMMQMMAHCMGQQRQLETDGSAKLTFLKSSGNQCPRAPFALQDAIATQAIPSQQALPSPPSAFAAIAPDTSSEAVTTEGASKGEKRKAEATESLDAMLQAMDDRASELKEK